MRRLLMPLLLLSLIAALVAGCGTDGVAEEDSSGADTASGHSAAQDASAAADPGGEGITSAPGGPDEIPAGRDVSAGGNPEYTFRELWRAGLVFAREWMPDAYLVRAAGAYVNDDGVPSEWMMTFVSPSEGEHRLDVWVDPWGNVTRDEMWEDGSADEVAAYREAYGLVAVPFQIIDSDQAMAVALEALAETDRADWKDPMLSIRGDVALWGFEYFYLPTAEYRNVQIDAIGGETLD